MSWGPSPLSLTPSSSYNAASRLDMTSAWLTGNPYNKLQNNSQPRSSTTIRSRKNINITSTNCSGTTALATISNNNSCRRLGTHGTPECAFQMGRFDPHYIISSLTTTSTWTSLTHIAYDRLLWPASKPYISSWGNPTST